uniref:Uncharacterized protein n=1 Tax=Romanomermis culicivorax TaxID=13658 RepID=A0A915J8W7_ROMCU
MPAIRWTTPDCPSMLRTDQRSAIAALYTPTETSLRSIVAPATLRTSSLAFGAETVKFCSTSKFSPPIANKESSRRTTSCPAFDVVESVHIFKYRLLCKKSYFARPPQSSQNRPVKFGGQIQFPPEQMPPLKQGFVLTSHFKAVDVDNRRFCRRIPLPPPLPFRMSSTKFRASWLLEEG